MKPASIQEIKQELNSLPAGQLTEIVLRLARFKKENKELLTYLLFEAHQQEHYIKQAQEEMTEIFSAINLSHLYFARKTIRKALRFVNKQVRITGSPVVELELRLFFLELFQNTGIDLSRSQVLNNLYTLELRKLKKALEALHEDLQFEYRGRIRLLEEENN